MDTTGAVNRVEHLMGTVFTVAVYDAGADVSDTDDVIEWFWSVDRRFSTFRDDSEITLIGQDALRADDASEDVRFVLDRCDELEVATGGRFSIRPKRSGAPGLDPAGFVKGWSVDRAASILRSRGFSRFSIDAGGDVLFAGPSPSGRSWRVGIRHPEDLDAVGAVLRIDEGAVATSGTYIRGDHIWGSGAGENLKSVSVVGPNLGVADALATAIFGDQAASLAWMARFPEYGVVLISSDDKVRWTGYLNGKVEPLE